MLFGGLKASSDTLQSRLELPDASVDVLAGIMFVLILLFETLYGRYRVFQPRSTLPDRTGTPSVPARRCEARPPDSRCVTAFG